jgi:hypothetical protein
MVKHFQEYATTKGFLLSEHTKQFSTTTDYLISFLEKAVNPWD